MAQTRIGVLGCAGRVGRMLVADIAATEECVLAGGTARPKGFKELFERTLRARPFPIEVAEVRVAADPFTATARGAYIAAMFEK